MSDEAPLTVQEIAEIAARLAAVTPGPWEHIRSDEYDDGEVPVWDVCLTGTDNAGVEHTVTAHSEMPEETPAGADAEFITHAPADMRRLLAELQRAHAERDAALAKAERRSAGMDHASEKVTEYVNLWRKAEAERDALGSALCDIEAERDALAGQLAAAERAQLERDCAVLCEECRAPDDAEPMVRQGTAELINGIWYHRRFVKSDGVELGPVRCSARRLRTAALAGADTLGGGAESVE